jgi:hypothetical protein
VSVEDDKRQGDKAPAEREDMLKIWDLINEQSMSSQIPLGSVMEFARIT